MFLRGILLLATLSSTYAQLQTIPPNIKTVDFGECLPQFEIGGFFISGCTTLGLPPDKPWCKLAAPPAQGLKWALCDPKSIPIRQTLVPGVTCDTATRLPVPANAGPGVRGAIVAGCYTRSRSEQFVCNVNGGKQRAACAATAGVGATGNTRATNAAGAGATAPNSAAGGNTGATNAAARGTGGARSAAATSVGSTPNTRPPSESPAPQDDLTNGGSTEGSGAQSMSTGAIVGIVVGLLVVIAGISYAIFRWRQGPNESDQHAKQPPTHIKIESTYGGPNTASSESDFAPLPLPPTFAADSSKRSSSQFGGRLTMNFEQEAQPGEDYFNQEPIARCVVTSTYATSLPDELVIMPGDILDLYQEFNDGWGAAVNLTRDGARGVFPLYCIENEK